MYIIIYVKHVKKDVTGRPDNDKILVSAGSLRKIICITYTFKTQIIGTGSKRVPFRERNIISKVF
jgi:hypothetical protein